MPLAKHNDMVKAIPPDRSDKPLRTSVLPWRSRRNRPIPNAHRSKTAEKDIAIDAISVANDISRRLLPPVCLCQLPGNPFGARMRGYTQPQKLATTVLQDQQSVQQPKRDRRDQEQIHRCDAVGMIAKEGLPALRRRRPPPRHILCHRGLSDVDAKLEEFAVYPRSAPKRICDTHLANETANVARRRRPATARSGFPAPIGSEACTVPAHQRLRPYNLQSVQDPGSQAVEPNQATAGRCSRGSLASGICVAERSADAEVRGFRLPTQPATGTARSTLTRSIGKDRSSIALSTNSRMSVSCFGFAVGTGG